MIRDLVYLFIYLFKKIEFRIFRLFRIPNSEFRHSGFSNLALQGYRQGLDSLSNPESNRNSCKVVLTLESVDKIVKSDHSDESYCAVLSRGAVCYVVEAVVLLSRSTKS